MIANVIDRRKREYRWKCVNAIVEAVWHDNNCKDSDYADPNPEHDLVYDQKENISLGEAIEWASTLKAEVTLYLYDQGRGTTVSKKRLQ